MKDNIIKARNKEKELINGQMEVILKENGLIIKLMVMYNFNRK